jgi:hypothetical protein
MCLISSISPLVTRFQHVEHAADNFFGVEVWLLVKYSFTCVKNSSLCRSLTGLPAGFHARGAPDRTGLSRLAAIKFVGYLTELMVV